MRVPLWLLGGVAVLSLAVARALSCICSPLECDPLGGDDCPGGLTWDPCKCCKVCARLEGEPCGGLFGFSGRCALGLQCVIKNLVPHPRDSALDEGVCTKIPGRTRRRCAGGTRQSEPGCNLVGEGSAQEQGQCACGSAVLWCPEDEPQPYTYRTRHECELNLAAKMAYDGLYERAQTRPDNAHGELHALPLAQESRQLFFLFARSSALFILFTLSPRSQGSLAAHPRQDKGLAPPLPIYPFAAFSTLAPNVHTLDASVPSSRYISPSRRYPMDSSVLAFSRCCC
ncbi:uncharacterized protein LOC131662913 [Phymastichus coffea]|uniref:uncharacterized protein LOC131662913 n=1 Tax=Phymastichus coffea TaxID=108790 RepID=UPI00273B35CC|nr:uncharacterized protein LOC131662913 [Phymastichus coffea]